MKEDKKDVNLEDLKVVEESAEEKTLADDATEEVVSEATKEATEEVVEEDFKVKYIKVLAEMENFRKRFEAEKLELIKFRASSFIQNILPTVDMFEMAMNATNVSDEVKNWLVGFEMILNNFKATLEAEGVTEIPTKPGDEFDANKHHAIEEVESDEVEPGKIVQVKMKGYLLYDKLLRATTVTVAKAKAEEGE